MKAMEIVLPNGKKITMREPKRQELGLFLRSGTALEAIGKIIEAVDQNKQGIIVPVPDMPPDEVLAPLDDLMMACTGMGKEEYDELSSLLYSWLALVKAFGALQNFLSVEPTS